MSNNCSPSLVFQQIPPIGSQEDLHGQANCLSSYSDYKVAVYIYVSGWWTKPTFTTPLISINPDGSWIADITTGGNDETATLIAAFLIPNHYTPPLLSGVSNLPAELHQNALAKHHVERYLRGARTLIFSDMTWDVKESEYPVEPGPNYFSDDPKHVWVDGTGQLHLTIHSSNGRWYSSEIYSSEPFGYGAYTFTCSTPVGQLDPNAVLGMFTWFGSAPEDNYKELDIEFSRWTDPSAPNAQYVIQPWDLPGNLHRFTINPNITQTTHSITWQPGFIQFASYMGQPINPQPGDLLQMWIPSQNDIPSPGAYFHLNLWLVDGKPPQSGQPIEVIISHFMLKSSP